VSSVCVEVADAVVAEINDAKLGMPLSAARSYEPGHTLDELQVVQISVVPATLEIGQAARSAGSYDYSIQVGVQKKLLAADGEPLRDEIDGLVELTEQIGDLLRNRRLKQYMNACCTGVKHEPICAAEHLLEMRVFTAVLTMTYRVYR
jgi:hypothetical protein